VDSDYHLEEPLHMKANAVNFWLRHWLCLQNKVMCPLVLVDNFNKSPNIHVTVALSLAITSTRYKGKCRAQYIDPSDSDTLDKVDNKSVGAPVTSNPDWDTDNHPAGDGVGDNAINLANNHSTHTHHTSPAASITGSQTECVLPLSPFSGLHTRKSCSGFLKSLSADIHYQNMTVLLGAITVSVMLFVALVADPFVRMVTSWRDVCWNGHLGHLRTTMYPIPFMMPTYHHPLQPSSYRY
jgi:hypothetical protein